MKRKYRILAIEEDDYQYIIKHLLDIFDVDSNEYTPEQRKAFDTFWNYINQEKRIGSATDAVLFEYQRLMLPFDVRGELPKNSPEEEVVDGISTFMDSISDVFWPHITNGLKKGESFTEQLQKLIND